MAKIALLTDTHFGVRNDNPIVLENMKRSMDFFFREIEARKIDDIIHLGDLYDRRKYVNYLTSSVCRNSFLVPASRNYRTHIVIGNHDQYFKNTHEVNALRELVAGRYANINVYSTPSEVNVAGLDILLLPWISDDNRDVAEQAIKNSTARVAMGHLELTGFEMYRGVPMQHGDDPNLYSKFEGVYTGHYHRRSSLDNVHYIGAMGEYTWSDYGCPRGFTILDTETLDMEFVENPNRLFRQIRYDDANDKDVLTTVKSIDFSEYANTYVKVVVTNRENPFAFETMMDRLYEANPVDISIVDDVDTFVDNLEDEEVDEAQDTPSILDSYISGLTLSVPEQKMKDYMRSVYKTAISMDHIE